MRLMSRALKRAGVAVAYSKGFNPRPHLSLAVPLAIGITSRTELMDIFFERPVSPQFLITALNRQLPKGMEVLEVYQVLPTQQSLQSLVRQAEYEVELETEKSETEVLQMLDYLLKRESLPWQHKRDAAIRSYDLRKLVADLWLIECNKGTCTIGMRLRCDPSGSGRPEQVAKALGFNNRPLAVERSRLLLEAS
jgi:radical SAM-linked protein